jgi:hypothetical protein
LLERLEGDLSQEKLEFLVRDFEERAQWFEYP